MAFDEDPTLFYDTDDFAVTATYDGATPVDGIFTRAYREVNGVGTYMPAFDCAAADVSGVTTGKQIVIEGTTYKVIDPRPDGQGFMKLLLNKVTS